MKRLKTFLIIFGAFAALLIVILVITGFILMQRPSIRYLVHMSDIISPSNYTKKEISIRVDDRDVSVMVYSPSDKKTKRNFVLIHGLTPQGNKHEKLDLMARSFCSAGGMNIFIPQIDSFNVQGLAYPDVTNEIAEVYTAIYKKFPGTYRAFGACFGGVALLGSLYKVPQEMYPVKVLLYGPFTDGRKLMAFYNKINADVDIIVKLGVSARMDIFSPDEKKLLRKAISLSGSGKTDESKVKRIIGEKLFNTISVIKLQQKDLEEVGVETLFGTGKKIPDTKYYILHSKGDNIVPFSEGKNFFDAMKSREANVSFFGTELFSHTENKVTVKGFLKELKYMNNFFTEFLED